MPTLAGMSLVQSTAGGGGGRVFPASSALMCGTRGLKLRCRRPACAACPFPPIVVDDAYRHGIDRIGYAIMSDADVNGFTQSGDHLLGGRVRHAQPRRGFRSGIEPVLLAAAIPAKPGQRVLEGGCGAGAALLCLAARVATVRGVGIEQDPALVALARRNAADNERSGLTFIAGDVAADSDAGRFDHAFAN